MNPQLLVEISADSVASAVAAERGGAARIELGSALSEGGLTPSVGLIETTRAAVKFDIHVMIRPRAGDFCYDDHEFDAMRRDIHSVKRLGANGIVIGILDSNGKIDIGRTRELVDLARPLDVTFHRAFDMTCDLLQALEDVCSAGADRILTSGGERNAWEGRSIITQLVKQAQGRITIMPGSGIKPQNARSLVEHTGVQEIHAGLKSSLDSPMLFRNPRISMGDVEGREYQRFAVLEENVQTLLRALAAET
jgi:copper homeostasis protein